ncbi:hypothetical protein Ndes2437B_g05834 [Nannochloris sp. 'desiccata']|nr:hypothetical protein KSW81_007803 [Chlorella desiccata (nom. nud.)]
MSESVDPLSRIVKHLDTGAPPADQAAACATIAILCSQPTPPENLDGVCAKLLNLLAGSEEGVKPNVIAAISAGMEVSEQVYKDAITGGAAQKLVPLLTSAAPTAAAAENSTDQQKQPEVSASRQIILNSLTALGALGECSEEGRTSVLEAGGVPAVVAYCSPEHDVLIQEAAVDSICKLMSSGSGVKEAAEKAGIVSKLAELLSADQRKAEITVRALLGLGMVMAGSEQAQLELASAPGAVGALLSLMRQGDDGDIQHIAAGLFSGLASAPAAKEALAAAMRDAQKTAEATAKYVT